MLLSDRLRHDQGSRQRKIKHSKDANTLFLLSQGSELRADCPKDALNRAQSAVRVRGSRRALSARADAP